MTSRRRLACLATTCATAILILAVPVGAQPSAPPIVLAETARGSVSILTGTDVIEIASGLYRPVVVAASPGSDRIIVGQAGPPNGPASIVAFSPGGPRETLAAGLVGIADIAVMADGQVLYVTGADGTVRAADDLRTTSVATVDGIAIGLAPLEGDRILVITQAGLGSIVDRSRGSVEGVVQMPGTAPGRPSASPSLDVVCVPDAVRGEVNCAPLGNEAGFIIDSMPGARAVSANANGQLVVAQGDVVRLVTAPEGVTLQRWALAVSDVAVLSSSAAWLGVQPTTRPTPAGGDQEESSELWLLMLGVGAGLGAILLTLYLRWNDPNPPRRAHRRRDMADDRTPSGDV